MLNRALSISIIAILFLLSLQAVWLFRIIDNEKSTFRKQTEQVLRDAINKELNTRIEKISKSNKFSVTISNDTPSDFQISKKVQSVNFKNNNKDFTKFTLEEALQLAYKDIYPLNLDSLSNYFSEFLLKTGETDKFCSHLY